MHTSHTRATYKARVFMSEQSIQKVTAKTGRLDSVLAAELRVSRSQVAQWVSMCLVQVSGQVVTKASHKLRGGEELSVTIPPSPSNAIEPENIPLDVLYEDDALIAINKAAGMVTHPTASLHTGTLVNALLKRLDLPQQDGYDGVDGYRPGIVHRLDKETSGVIVVAKTVKAHAALTQAFKERQVKKTYLALVAGTWKAQHPVEVRAPIGRHPTQRQRMTAGGLNAREAQTRLIPLSQHRDANGRTLAFVKAEPHTGRTHQIRVHLVHVGSPIIGDGVYGRHSSVISRQALHAQALSVPHPHTNEVLHLQAPLPADILEAWVALEGQIPTDLT